jgi:ATP-binding cassette subfamily F protein 3
LSRSHSGTDGSSVFTPLSLTAAAPPGIDAISSSDSPHPPPFSSLYFPPRAPAHEEESPPAFAAAPPFTESSSSAAAAAAAETKAALPRDTKHAAPRKDVDDGEPPPPYSEGSSPLDSFSYVMASAGGPASILTQVSQSSAGPPINTLGGSDENITLELRYAAARTSRCIARKLTCPGARASRSRATNS